MAFKKDFVWGVATASYQIEGAIAEDGKGENVWDTGCKTEGHVLENNSGEFACDHYHRYLEDVQLLKNLGVDSYRLSISWSRILPNGIGKVNKKGLEFYHKLFDALLENNIEPYVTLFHWDYPTDLFNKGGWLNDDSSLWFEEYAKIIATEFKGKVKNYFTINEPQCVVDLGHRQAVHAPFQKMSNAECMRVLHNILKANGRAFKAIKEIDKTAKVGIVQTASIVMPHEKTEKAEQLAYDKHFASQGAHFFQSATYSDPIFLGTYPKDFIKDLKIEFKPSKADMDIIRCDMDMIGLNIYHGDYIKQEKDGSVTKITPPLGAAKTAMDWPMAPESVYYGTKHFHKRYNKPIMITENGLAISEWKALDGKVEDPMRIDFINRYLAELERASDDGANITGYFHWSFLDNFEWAFGYAKRFGIVYVDFETFERIPKSSYYHYSDIIKKNKN